MSTINFKIDYNGVDTTNPEMGSEALARKSRYILKNKLGGAYKRVGDRLPSDFEAQDIIDKAGDRIVKQ